MRRLSLIALMALPILGCSALPTANMHGMRIPAADTRIAPDRLIVVTIPNDSSPAIRAGSTPRAYEGFLPYTSSTEARETAAALAARYHLRAIASWPIATLSVHCIVFEISEDASRATLLSELALDKRVSLAQPMQTFDTLTQHYNDPYVSLQRGFQQIDVAGAQEWSSGERVRVAIIDTGIDVSHPDLQGRVVLQNNFVDSDAEQFKRDRHGTEVAGVIAAVANNHKGIVGVAPRVALLAFKACWQLTANEDGARCNSFTLAQALVAAMDAGAQVVNLSLAGPPDPLLSALIVQGVRRGIVFVGAVSPASADGFPSNAAGVLAVAAAEAPANGHHELLAPGREILTLLPGARYDFASGSSLAAAHVTGTVALLLAQNRHLNPARLYELLSRTSNTHAQKVASINACAALGSIMAHVHCESPPAPTLAMAESIQATQPPRK